MRSRSCGHIQGTRYGLAEHNHCGIYTSSSYFVGLKAVGSVTSLKSPEELVFSQPQFGKSRIQVNWGSLWAMPLLRMG
jgi:hypothetical protein